MCIYGFLALLKDQYKRHHPPHSVIKASNRVPLLLFVSFDTVSLLYSRILIEPHHIIVHSIIRYTCDAQGSVFKQWGWG